MKRLFRISFDILVISITPIISWFLLGIILEKELINVFSLTYPLQCLTLMIVAVFGVGANICSYKSENKNAIDNGIFYGIAISIFIFSFLIYNCENFINFMNMNPSIYKTFCIYSMFQIFCQVILQLILTKLYYKEENKKANKIVLTFNVINFLVLISVAFLSKNQVVSAIVSGFIMFVMTIFLLIKNIEKIDFKLNVKNCFKNNSSAFCISFLYFIMYLFGLSNTFQFGEKYILAISFVVLVTDMQWDITEAVNTVAKVDITKKKFNYNEHLKNALKLHSLLALSALVMALILYPFYQPDIKIISIFIFFHVIDFMLCPFMEIKVCYLQLEDSAFKMTSNVIVAYLIRTFISFISTPYCIIIAQMCSTVYELVCTKINYKKYET